jgi:hypothetical protein
MFWPSIWTNHANQEIADRLPVMREYLESGLENEPDLFEMTNEELANDILAYTGGEYWMEDDEPLMIELIAIIRKEMSK